MNVSFVVNEAACETPPSTPGVFNVRVKYLNTQDAGHLSGPFGSREAAERAAVAAMSRAEVESATIETGA